MLRLITFELQKVWGKKLFKSMLTTLLITNVFLLWYTHQENEMDIPLSAYHAYHTDLNTLQNDQRMAFIQAYYDEVKGLELVENVKQYESWQTEQGRAMAKSCIEQNEEAYLNYLPLWESNDFLKYTNNIDQEILFAQEVYEEADKINHYEDFLSEIEATSNTLDNISIFSSGTSDDFSIHNIDKTSKDYQKMHGTQITHDISYGVVSATSSYFSDLFLCLFLFMFAAMLIHEEKEKNLLSLTKITPLGTYENIAAKIISLFINTAVVTLLIYGTNYIFFHMNVGFGDLNRTIQSIGAFMGSTEQISIGTFLISFLFIKWIVCFTIGLLVLLIAILAKHSTISYFLCTMILLCSYVLFRYLPDNSTYTFFKYINLFAFFQVQTIFSTYLNLNIGGYAISLFVLSLSSIAILLIVFCLSTISAFVSSHHIVQLTLPNKKQLKIHFFLPYRPSVVLIKHELYKTFIINKSLLLCIIFFVLMINQYRSSSIYLAPEEMYYKTYMSTVQGKLTDEKIAYLNLEKEKYTNIHAKLEEIASLQKEQNLSTIQVQAMSSSYLNQLNAESAFERLWQQYEHLKAHPEADFIYDSGYLRLFEIEDKTSSNNALLSISILLILCCYRLFSMEFTTGANRLIATTAKGKTSIVHAKVSIAISIAIATCLLDGILHIISIYQTYGLSSLNASITSMQAYAHLPSNITILGFMMFLFTLKVGICCSFVLVILAISLMVKHNLYALLMSILIIIVPILFVIMGLQWCSYVSLIPLFHAGYYIGQSQGGILLGYACICVLLGTLSYFYLRHKS